MKRVKLGELDARVVGEGDGPVVVLLHGFGAPGDDLVPLQQYLGGPAGTRYVFPEAPIVLPGMFGDGRAWWMIDVEKIQLAALSGETRDLREETPVGLHQANEKLSSVIDAIEREWNVASSRIVLGGFSQGAMLAADVVLRSGKSFAGLILMSGTLLAEKEWVPLMAKCSGLPVFQSHGQFDPLLPFALAEMLRDRWTAAGASHTWVPFGGQHEIPPPVLSGVRTFIADCLR